MCDLPHRLGHYCSPRTSGQGNPDNRRDSSLRNSAWFVLWSEKPWEYSLIVIFRFPDFLHGRGCLCNCHDLPSCAKIWEEEPSHLPLHLLDGWLCLCHVCQGIRHCREVDFGRQQPIYTPLDLRLHHLDGGLYLDPDELF